MRSAGNSYGALLLRGYGPLVGLMIAFALVAMLAPTLDTELAAGSGSEGAGGGGGAASGLPMGQAEGESSDAAVATDAPDAASERDGAAGGATDGGQGGDGNGNGNGGGNGGTEQAAVGACADRELQVPGDPYSPPCVAFDGDNGGATARGVTEDTILISARIPDEPGFQDELANLADADIADSPEDVRRTFTALLDYFNDRFEFYGRELEIEFYEGQGSATEELLGGGREEARADALTVAREFEAFAEMNASSEPFAGALSEEGVVNFGAPFVSRYWMDERQPYSWSLATDCSIVAESGAHYANQRLANRPAEHARGDLKDRDRRIANVVPENPWYQECLEDALEIARAEGNDADLNLSYQLDLSTLSNQAANLVARLQNEDITTVICSCDPVLPVFLTARASEQDYFPEWVITGVGFTDQDFVGQLFDQRQWERAFGISYIGQVEPQGATLGYHAYKAVRDDEPAFSVGVIYYNLYLLAIGIQGAGPNLTPETFQQGMFDYPGGQGPAGTWAFGEQNRTPTEDFREVYWDPEAVSPFNNQQGAYIDPEPGSRYRFGELRDGPPRVPW